MRLRFVLPALAVIGPFVFGCGQKPSAATSPSPSTAAPAGPSANGQGFNASEAAALLKAVTDANRSGSGTTSAGTNNSTLSVGSHTLKTTVDIPASTLMQGESAVISLGGKKVVVEFDKGRVLLDDIEQAKLPAGTKEVEIQFVGGKLSITADGTAVLAHSAPR